MERSCLDHVVLAIVSVEVHALDLAHERITGVSAGALVVEGLFGHFVKTRKEIGFIRNIVADSLLNADALLEIIDSGNEVSSFSVSFLPLIRGNRLLLRNERACADGRTAGRYPSWWELQRH